MFAGARRYHKGGVAGLMPGEVSVILQRGEVVIPKGGVRSAGGQSIVIHAPINAPGADAAALAHVKRSVQEFGTNSRRWWAGAGRGLIAMARVVSWPIGLKANARESLAEPRAVGAGVTQSIGNFTQTFGSSFDLWRWRFIHDAQTVLNIIKLAN